MVVPQYSSPTQLYPQYIQLKLYQAFIFSIPILFSIILCLLFYLFYLKRRTSSSFPASFNHVSTSAPTSSQVGLKGEIRDKFPIVLFDEEQSGRDSQCSVCLGEFEVKEELLQVPSCEHVFHVECIRHWLHSNSTCPLCRCSVVSDLSCNQIFQVELSHSQQHDTNSEQQPRNIVSSPQQVLGSGDTLDVSTSSTEGSSGDSTFGSSDNQSASVVVHIQTHC